MPSDSEREEFRNQVCLPMLAGSQNPDGGWGYQAGKQSATEATAWALLALARPADSAKWADAVARGKQWLCQTQLPDHSWPAFAEVTEGSWLTSLACLALHEHGDAAEAVAAGTNWLCNQWPAEGVLWRRWLVRLFVKRDLVRQNLALRGWSWTPGTSSWVEPTACAL